MNGNKTSTNVPDLTDEQLDQVIRNKSRQYKTAARRNRNFDRAVMIAARLNFEGVLRSEDQDFYDFHFENTVKAVLDMLERFQLDSPDGEIVDIFGTSDNAPGA